MICMFKERLCQTEQVKLQHTKKKKKKEKLIKEILKKGTEM